MGCHGPLLAYRSAVINPSGRRSLVFDKSKAFSPVPVRIPCGRCTGCRLQRSADWAVRCMNEASLYDSNCFITLTYDNENLPAGNSLYYDDFQKFLKRLRQYSVRRRGRSFKFYMCGEYGEDFSRPHYHSLLFDFDFSDKKYFRTTRGGHKVYTSDTLSDVWGKGLCEVGSVTYDSAGYVARYCLKKITGEDADAHYEFVDADGRSHSRVPEFGNNSNGIGKAWLAKHHRDVYSVDFSARQGAIVGHQFDVEYSGDFVLLKGNKMRPPRYYDNQFEVLYPDEFAVIKEVRKRRRVKRDEGFRRYCAREEVARAKLSTFSQRSL